jgi:hypothetical protein
VLTDKEASSAIVPSIVHNEDGVVKDSEVSDTHVTLPGGEQTVPSTTGPTSEPPKAVSFRAFQAFLKKGTLISNRPKK